MTLKEFIEFKYNVVWIDTFLTSYFEVDNKDYTK